jgi:predicted GIY-YIG superfamily endonuclease
MMALSPCGYVYIIQLERPMGSTRHSARFYIGWAKNIDTRLADHRAGRGSAMLRAAVERGIRFDIVAYMPGDKSLERWLKNKKNGKAALRWMNNQHTVCPCCHRHIIHITEGICWYCELDQQMIDQTAPDDASKDESDRVATV